MRATTHSEIGSAHKRNEDFVICQPHPIDGSSYLCVLADGQGGRPDGDKAAHIACKTALSAATSRSVQALQSPSEWTEIILRADSQVALNTEGAATLIACIASPDGICGASVGDSMALLITADSAAHNLTERQNKNPPIGSGEAFGMPFSYPQPGDSKLLMMSDGVWKYAGYQRIVESASRLSGEQLIVNIREAVGSNLPDDFTLAVIEQFSAE